MRIFSGRCTSNVRLNGKTALITGCNTGIGKVTVQDFFKRGARVIMACRDLNKAKTAAEDIKRNCKNDKDTGEIVFAELDLSSLKSVRNCAKKIMETENEINLLINNAGVMLCPPGKTEDGFDMQFGTNHLGHFLLTLLLLPKIIKSAPARIVNVSSMAHTGGTMYFDDLNFEKRNFSSLQAYQQSKLANVLFTKELARRLEVENVKNVTVYSLHPGVIKTDLGRHMDATFFPGAAWLWRNLFSFFMKSPEMGAQTTIYCAVDEKAANETGLYYSDCEAIEPSPKAKNIEDAKKLWETSLQLVGLEKNYNPFEM